MKIAMAGLNQGKFPRSG